jgi:hypothetical protein
MQNVPFQGRKEIRHKYLGSLKMALFEGSTSQEDQPQWSKQLSLLLNLRAQPQGLGATLRRFTKASRTNPKP